MAISFDAIGRHCGRALRFSFALVALPVVTGAAQVTRPVVKGHGAAVQVGPRFVSGDNGKTAYDRLLDVTWLANGNLARDSAFGVDSIRASGSMTYDAAVAWVGKLNAKNYLGHHTWTIPTSPKTDKTCSRKSGPYNNSFGYNCTGSMLGSLYFGLGFREPNTVVAIPANSVQGFRNFQPYLYWAEPLSEHKGADSEANPNGYISFSFNTGYKGSNVVPDFLYVLPMIKGKVTLPVRLAQEILYDAGQDVTWLRNANLAATDTLGVPGINRDGAMDHATAAKFVDAMNARRYLGQSHWQLPSADTLDAGCRPKPNFGYHCRNSAMGKLYYDLLKVPEGEPVVTTPDVAVGPFHNIQPYLYWSCLGEDRKACGHDPAATHFQFSFSFGNGYQGTDYMSADLYLMVYYSGGAPPTESGPPKCPGGKCLKPPA
jgi:hypothetical protein